MTTVQSVSKVSLHAASPCYTQLSSLRQASHASQPGLMNAHAHPASYTAFCRDAESRPLYSPTRGPELHTIQVIKQAGPGTTRLRDSRRDGEGWRHGAPQRVGAQSERCAMEPR